MKRFISILLLSLTLVLFGCSEDATPSEGDFTYPEDTYIKIDLHFPVDEYRLSDSSNPGLPIDVFSTYPFTINCGVTGNLVLWDMESGKITQLENIIEGAQSNIYYWVPNQEEIVENPIGEQQLICEVGFYNNSEVVYAGIYWTGGYYYGKIMEKTDE